jgi:hypothetical protein
VPLHRLDHVPSPPLSTYKSRPRASLLKDRMATREGGSE